MDAISARLLMSGAGWVRPPLVASANGNASGATLVINKPTGCLDGDLLLAFCISEATGDGVTWTPPGGWTEANDDGLMPHLYVARKVASSEGATFTFTATGGSDTAGVVLCYRFAQYQGIGTVCRANDTSVDVTGVGAVEPLPYVVVAAGNRVANAMSASGSDLTLLDSSNVAGRPWINVWGFAPTTTGTTSTRTITQSTTVNIAGVQVAIKRL